MLYENVNIIGTKKDKTIKQTAFCAKRNRDYAARLKISVELTVS
jgi:hypothetical protein